jgi:cytidylate kinase
MPIKSDSLKWDRLVKSQVSLWEVRKQLEDEEGKKGGNPWEKAHITISRAYGARGYEISKIMAQKLNWEVYGGNLVQYISETSKIRHKVVESFDEKKTNEMQNWIHTIMDTRAMGTDRFLKHLVSVLVSIAEHGQAVIVGRGGNYALDKKSGLHVRVTAPFDMRVKRIVEAKDISLREARKIVKQKDSERAAFVRRYFHSDIANAEDYDLVINKENIDVEHGAEIILKAMEIKLDAERPAPDLSKEITFADESEEF